MNNLYALIMAGGGGTRLWPLSRQNRPKQMLALIEDHTMFQISVERLEPLLPADRIYIITGADQVEALRHSAPQVPAANFIVEPFGRNTGPAVGLGIIHIQRRDPDAVIAVLTADQHIADKAKFRRVLAAGAEVASDNRIVTLGITPSFPSTGYGYIKRGDPLVKSGEFQVYHAAQFTEKPGLETAIEFLTSGLYSWNSGMFIFQVDQLLAEYARQQPEMFALLQTIKAAIGCHDYEAVLQQAWPQMPRLSIDYAVMEGAERMAVIPVDMGWSDIGSWKSLLGVLESDGNGNVIRGRRHDHIQIDTRGTLIVSDRRVVTIGLEDIVIVDTDDVLLVCHRDRSEDVRRVVDQLRDAGDETHL